MNCLKLEVHCIPSNKSVPQIHKISFMVFLCFNCSPFFILKFWSKKCITVPLFCIVLYIFNFHFPPYPLKLNDNENLWIYGIFYNCIVYFQATFQVHQGKSAEVTNMLCVGEGVWIAFKMDSVLRLYNASSFAHMQDLNIGPSIHKILGMYVRYWVCM